MAVCNFCGRSFGSSQGVIAHLRHCASYKQQRQSHSAPPRALRVLTDAARIRQLLESVPSYARRPAASPVPRPPALRLIPRAESNRAHEERAQEARRQQEMLQEAQRRQAAEYRARDAQRRTLIQHIKGLVVDLYVTWEPIPAAALADAKVAIERVFAQLPILELPQHELRQIATAVRERVYTRYRQAPAQPSVAVPTSRDVTPVLVPPQPKEIVMPMHRIVSGDFFCPRCDEEFALDRVPEQEALCADCRVQLEEFEDDEEDDDGE